MLKVFLLGWGFCKVSQLSHIEYNCLETSQYMYAHQHYGISESIGLGELNMLP